MSDIKGARKKLKKIARELRLLGKKKQASDILAIVDRDMYRRSPARRMAKRSSPVTIAIKRRVIDLAETTDMHSDEIAVSLNINPGRVSEILQGDR